MKQNTKGFTLIELLAVIVILAIIALIATPIVLNMINEARKSSAKSSSLGYIDSIEYYAGFAEANATGMSIAGYDAELPAAGQYTYTAASVNAATTKPEANATATAKANYFFNRVNTKSKGKAPEDNSTVTLDANGKVTGASLKYNGFTCSYNGTTSEVTCS